MQHLSSSSPESNRAPRRGGFTLIEILVAVAIMSLLLTIIMVPLRLAFDSFHTGQARTSVQQAAQTSLKEMAADIRKAQFIFPNSYVPNVSDNTGVTSNCSPPAYNKGGANTNDWDSRPYVITDDPAKTDSPSVGTGHGVCDAISTPGTPSMRAWDNPARIDMLQVRRNDDGSIPNSSAGQDYIITYYARRLNIGKDYEPVDNPVVLFRAQIPFRLRSNATGTPPAGDFKVSSTDFNAQIDWTQYPASIGACATSPGPPSNRDFLWITHNFWGEADLEPLTTTDAIGNPSTTIAVPGAHTLAIPSDMGLVTPRASTILNTPATSGEALVPDLSFIEEATKGARIDRVTINMTLAQYDRSGTGMVNGQPAAQRVRVSQTVNIPNVGCAP